MNIPAAPWKFRLLGANVALFADHGSRNVLLSTKRLEQLQTRGDTGRLIALTPDHPVARAIETAPMGIELAREIVEYFGDDEIEPLLTTDIKLREMARAILAHAEGRS